MKFCKPHWEELREKIRERGLDEFVAKSGEEIVQRMGEGAFDPLMNAHNRILEHCFLVLGLGVMAAGDDVCPLCELIRSCNCGRGAECSFLTYTTQAADEQLDWAKHFGLAVRC